MALVRAMVRHALEPWWHRQRSRFWSRFCAAWVHLATVTISQRSVGPAPKYYPTGYILHIYCIRPGPSGISYSGIKYFGFENNLI